METATTNAPETLFRPVSREMAADRWLGLMLNRINADVPSDLSDRLTAILGELAGGMGREPVSGDEVLGDISEMIGEWLVQWTEAGGISPTNVHQLVTFSGTPWASVEAGVKS